jgi:hypothetical protein
MLTMGVSRWPDSASGFESRPCYAPTRGRFFWASAFGSSPPLLCPPTGGLGGPRHSTGHSG